jgi:omega-6 fatty acid desaturase (delta-12 desaturase)
MLSTGERQNTVPEEEACTPPDSGIPAPIDPRQPVRDHKTFTNPQPWRGAGELAITLTPFLLLCWLTLATMEAGYLLALVLAGPAGLLLLRLFLIQHDCGHGSFFHRRSANDWLGRILGVFTLTPYDCWRRSHALHHAGTGNLDAPGFRRICPPRSNVSFCRAFALNRPSALGPRAAGLLLP